MNGLSEVSIFPVVPGHEIVGRVVKAVAVTSRNSKRETTPPLAVWSIPAASARTANVAWNSTVSGSRSLPITAATSTPAAPPTVGIRKTFWWTRHSCLQVSGKLDPAATAPLLCAGITTYSPLRHWKVGPGQKVGIVGLGGLGHMGVKFARALGAHVVLFTTSPGKTADALRLGADEVVVSKNADEMQKHASSFDFILDAVSADHDINAYLSLLKLDGTLVLVGAPEKPLPVAVFNLLLPRRQFAGSAIGGIAETQEMLDFCAEHGIVCDIELIAIQQVNEAYERLLKSDVQIPLCDRYGVTGLG